MTVNEFILQVANGKLHKDDILSFASNSWDTENLLWDLYLADKIVDDETGLPLIRREAEINRIANAIDIISSYFNVSLLFQNQEEYHSQEEEKPSENHYNSNADNLCLTKIFIKLQGLDYIDREIKIDQWLYICKGQEVPSVFLPIRWNSTQNTLVYLIARLFENTDSSRKWEIATEVFRVKVRNNYRAPDTDYFKSAWNKIQNMDHNKLSKGLQKFRNQIWDD